MSEAAPIRVLVVDDQQLLRRGLRLLLETTDRIEVAAEAVDGREALAQLAKQREAPINVVLSDARMPRMDGIELVTACAREYPNIPVVMLTTFDDDDVVLGSLGAGAAGFLLKDVSTDTLAEAIESAASGGMVIDPRVTRMALRGQRSESGADPLALLTRAERLVAQHVATGASNTEIAEHLVLAEGTVKNHVSALLRKLNARDRTALALALHRAFGD